MTMGAALSRQVESRGGVRYNGAGGIYLQEREDKEPCS